MLYEPGILKVVSYKNNQPWAEDSVKTTGEAVSLNLSADRTTIKADGKDLSFITVKITDQQGLTVPRSKNLLHFSIEGPGEIVATDNGDPTNLVSFSSKVREAFNGLCLVIVRGNANQADNIRLKVASAGMQTESIVIKSEK